MPRLSVSQDLCDQVLRNITLDRALETNDFQVEITAGTHDVNLKNTGRMS